MMARVNNQNQFVPSAILTRTGKIPVNTAKASSTKNFSTARQSFNRQTVLTSTAMRVNTVKPIVNRVRPANVLYKTHSPSSRPLKKTTVLRTYFTNQKVNNVKAYLAEFQDFKGGPVAFGVSKGGLACLIAKATTDESNKWHRRLGHVNFKNLNKLVRCDNGTEFKNKDVIEFCGSKGIKREYSNARTPQQNRVAERKNMTLIEAARTMLADSILPNTFWAKAVSTACMF
ncbi:putative ribonuclease H-like domain-containing protein [Tanacetum coccineum]